ncbi:hypothetical protein L207DRAFT_316918 [Hyaloscypha variabilis F]|uniref:Uncharacterized protein n=1 Tax=Hyaloscypha variabilis (strain UAMH 11265 / GT02V1 / F) TaxID=1149755 RepID=A0A2J6RVV3_HYAVF|nr:hypothetical protein L207DRAFT_316918 [Hyaloscypha variabilis F]
MLTNGASPFTTCIKNHQIAPGMSEGRYPHAPHSVKAVIDDLISTTIHLQNHLAIAAELRGLLKQKVELRQLSPNHIPFQGNDFDRRPKRRLASPSNEPRKRGRR